MRASYSLWNNPVDVVPQRNSKPQPIPTKITIAWLSTFGSPITLIQYSAVDVMFSRGVVLHLGTLLRFHVFVSSDRGSKHTPLSRSVVAQGFWKPVQYQVPQSNQ